jgi:hypothetical protein
MTEKNKIMSKSSITNNNDITSNWFKYMLKENKQGAVRNILQLPQEDKLISSYFQEKYGNRFAVQFARWFEESTPNIVDIYKSNTPDSIKMILDYFYSESKFVLAHLINYPNEINKLQNKSYQDAMSYVDSYGESTDSNVSETVLKVEDGFEWVNIGSECRLEGKRMKHCGKTKDGNLLSLRDEAGQPHVNITWNENDNSVQAISGKGNMFPNRKYWKYIKSFFDQFNSELKDQAVLMAIEQDNNQHLIEFANLVGASNNETQTL